MMKKGITSILISLVCLLGYSQTDSLLTTINWQNSLERQYNVINAINPAGEKYSVSNRFLHNTVKIKHIDQTLISTLEYGDTQTNYSINIDGYNKYSSSVLWGSAKYEFADIKNVNWNNVTDVHLLFPYIVADSIGGNRKQETYFLTGGYQYHLNNYTLGIETAYRAAIRYAQTNPRPLNTVSDFDLRFGVTRHLNKYNLGLSGGYGNYHQKLKVKMYGDRNTTYIYFLRGFGLHQDLLSGNASTQENDYFGNSVTGSVSLSPIHSGFTALFSYRYESIYHKETNGRNGIEPFKIDHKNIHSQIGYRWQTDLSDFESKLQLTQQKRIGTETTYERVGSEYEILTQSSPYNHTETNLSVNFFWNRRNTDNQNKFELFSSLEYSNTDAFHLDDGLDHFFMQINSFDPKLHYKWHVYKGASQWTINHLLQTKYILSSDGRLRNTDDLNQNDNPKDISPLFDVVHENYWRMTQNIFHTNLSLTYMYHMSNKKSIGIESGINIVSNGATSNIGGNINLTLNF
nr:DUF6850 family outer membrane beta-barrel protein [uncultured Carboxylicivirga sp.]